MKTEKLQNYLKKYLPLLTFFVLELLLLVSLNFAAVYGMLFRYVSIILVIAILPVLFIHFDKEKWLNLGLVLLLPLLMYGGFMSFSPLYYINNSIFDNLVLLFAIEAFVLLGVSMRYVDQFKIENALMIIVGFLAIGLFISLVYTWFRYGIFHVYRYRGQVLYFDGEIYPISNEVKWLFGFSFKEVKTSYFLQSAVYLTPILGGLLFVPFKNLKKLDLVWIISGVVGLVAILSLPAIRSLLYILPALVVLLMIRFYPKNDKAMRILKYVLLAALVIFVLAAIFLLLFAFEVPFIVKMVNNSAILNKLYGNSMVLGYAKVIKASINKPLGGFHYIFVNGSPIEATGSAVFDTLYQGGIIPFLGYIYLLVIGVIIMVRYFKNSNDAPYIKAILIAFMISFATYTLFKYDYAPFVREGEYIYKMPFYSDLNFLLIIFLLGYSYSKSAKVVLPEVVEVSND